MISKLQDISIVKNNLNTLQAKFYVFNKCVGLKLFPLPSHHLLQPIQVLASVLV